MNSDFVTVTFKISNVTSEIYGLFCLKKTGEKDKGNKLKPHLRGMNAFLGWRDPVL